MIRVDPAGSSESEEFHARLQFEIERLRIVESEAIERACEAALQGGTCGVLVIRSGGTTLIGPHESVPFGHIYEVLE